MYYLLGYCLDDAFAHRLRGRAPLEVRSKVHTLLLIVEVGALRDDKPRLYRIVERREFMHLDMVWACRSMPQ